MTNVVENYSPESPILKYASNPIKSGGKLNFITLFWDENVYKGNYHLYLMNKQGNWVQVAKIISDRLINGFYHVLNIDNLGNWVERTTFKSLDNLIYLPLELTNINVSFLNTKNTDGATIYHHFKIISENTSGMFSLKENILSIYNESSWIDSAGIAIPDHSKGMIIGATFIINPDGLGRLSIDEPLSNNLSFEIE